MEISLSEQGFNEKPKIPGIQYEKLNVNSKDLEAYIRKGHVLSANFNAKYPITQRDRTLSNFKSIQYVMIDMDDDIDCELEVLIDSLSLTPTIAYSTFSHGIKGSRYRLLYLFDNPITTIQEYKTLYSFICRECNLNLKDDCGSNPVQACIGSKEDCEYIFSDIIYNLNDLIEEDKEYKDLINSNFEISGQTDCILKEERSNILSLCPVDLTEEEIKEFYDSTFRVDFSKLSFKEILDKYRDKYDYFDKTPLPKTDADNPIIVLPENYVEIRRYIYKDQILDSKGKVRGYTYRIRKLQDGDGRRKKLFTASLLRRVMCPKVSFSHLLYCALYDLYHFCYNGIDPISKKDLISIVNRAVKADPQEELIKRSRPKKKCVANPDYCAKHCVSKSQAIGDNRRLLKLNNYAEIANIYNHLVTYGENIKKIEEVVGIKMSQKTLQRFLKETGLPRPVRKNSKAKKSQVSAPPIQEEYITLEIRHNSGKLLMDEAKAIIATFSKTQTSISLFDSEISTRLFA